MATVKGDQKQVYGGWLRWSSWWLNRGCNSGRKVDGPREWALTVNPSVAASHYRSSPTHVHSLDSEVITFSSRFGDAENLPNHLPKSN